MEAMTTEQENGFLKKITHEVVKYLVITILGVILTGIGVGVTFYFKTTAKDNDQDTILESHSKKIEKVEVSENQLQIDFNSMSIDPQLKTEQINSIRAILQEITKSQDEKIAQIAKTQDLMMSRQEKMYDLIFDALNNKK